MIIVKLIKTILSWLIAAGLFLLIVWPWFAVKYHEASTKLSLTIDWKLLDQKFMSAFFSRLLCYADWQVMWIVLIVAVIAYFDRAKAVAFILAVSFLDLAMVIIVCLAPSWRADLIIGTIQSRLLSHFAPVALITTAFILLPKEEMVKN